MTFYVAGAVVLSSVVGGSSARSAAKTQAAAADRAAELQQQQFERQVELQAPFREAGLTAQNRLMTLLGLAPQGVTGKGGLDGMGGSLLGTPIGAAGDVTSPDFGRYARGFGAADFQADPGYAFRLAEGQKALDRQAAARGGLISGGALKAAQRYGQEMGSQEYTNAFNRYQTERQAQLNPLQSLAGVGQTSSQQLGAAGQAMASGVGEAMGQAAQARASGYVGQANALSSALGTGLNYYQGQQYLNRLAPMPAVTPGYSGQGPMGYAP